MKYDTDKPDPHATRSLSGPSPPAPGPNANSGRRSGASSGRLEVRCPNCHEPTEVAVDTTLTDLTCSACGSHFSLVDQGQATRMAPALSKLGRFELIERIGVGGFGSVWKARDKELDRTVAIKVPRAGGMTGDEQEKFFREARAAAQLRHPSIVSVHEVGRDGDSVYIVSDFVRGATLGDWLTGQQLTSREAAELCAKIADALHHAHEQSVVHRDLKPANIMMDGDNQPHLMDFGLARREVGEITVTIDGQVLGTPAYMSPEQAQGEAHTADRRSDVYSLGVILFQLLTGELPFRGNARMLIKQVIDDEPPSPRKLNANIELDLETITLKCLEKETGRRYATSEELAEELRRFLSGQPIHARPIKRAERAVRWVQRNKTVSAVSALAILALVGGTVASTIFAFDSRRQAAAALVAAAEEKKAKEATVAREAETGAVLSFVENRVFAAARPEGQEGGLGHDVTLRQAIEYALPYVEESFTTQPLNEARLRMTLGTSFLYLDEPQTAAKQYEIARSLLADQRGPDHPETLLSMNNLATAYVDAGRLDEAIALYKQTLGMMLKKLGADDEYTFNAISGLANAYCNAGRLDEAIALNQQTLASRRKKLGPDHPDTLVSINNLARAYRAAGRLNEAIPLWEDALAARRKKLGPDHPDTLRSMNGLASAYYAVGRLNEAVPLYEQTLAARRKKLGADHSFTLYSMEGLANAYRAAGRLDEALPLYEQTLAGVQKKLGADHPDALAMMGNLAIAYRAAGRQNEGLPLYEKANQQLLQLGSFFSGMSLSVKMGPDAVDHLLDAAVARRGEETPQPLDALALGELRLVAGNPPSAEAAIRAAIKRDGIKPYYYKSLGWCLLAQGKVDDARQAFQEVLKDRKRKDGTFDLEKADPDHLTAAFFLDVVSEQAYVEYFASDNKLACFPWFYVAQRREIEGKKNAAIKAYERCVEVGAGDNPHTVRALAEWRLRKLKEIAPTGKE